MEGVPVFVTPGSRPGRGRSGFLSGFNTRTPVADTNYTAITLDRLIAYTSITAARTVTLPPANSFLPGIALFIVDESGSCSSTNTITLAAAGSDLIDGKTTAVINAPNGYIAVESNGNSKWTVTVRGLSPNFLSSIFANTTVTASNTGGDPANLHMCGFGMLFTPSRTGIIQAYCQGQASNSIATIDDVILCYGTGTAPGNDTARAGTQIGGTIIPYIFTANGLFQFGGLGIVSGLTLGTQYWFDMAAGTRSTSSTTTIFNPAITLVELQ